jgi:protocatechuate 3,4-dioxygenase alpha subunit
VLPLTPFQTVGPYLRLGLCSGISVVCEGGTRIVIKGRLIDGAGDGIPDGVVEVWHPALSEVQRALTDRDGRFVIETLRPDAVPGPGGREQAPHLAARVLARGILTQYVTRIYFEDESRNASDQILDLVPEARRHTLVARASGPDSYMFDIVLQGEGETVFFDV